MSDDQKSLDISNILKEGSIKSDNSGQKEKFTKEQKDKIDKIKEEQISIEYKIFTNEEEINNLKNQLQSTEDRELKISLLFTLYEETLKLQHQLSDLEKDLSKIYISSR